MIVLGIDPGLSRCGYGVLRSARPHGAAVAAGVVRTDTSEPVPARLARLQREIEALIDEYGPDAVAIERVLFQVNVRTAMGVGQASGVVMATAATAGCAVAEYSPNEVKLAVTGWGRADKEQMMEMVRTQLRIGELNSPDAADALAVAMCHLAMSPLTTAVQR